MAQHRFTAGVVVMSFLLLPPVAVGQNIQQEASRSVKTRVEPAYPALAREMHIGGHVKIEVTVAPDGTIKSIRVLGGHPLLVKAATDAIKGWRYESAPKASTETIEVVFSGAIS
ncbi:MAG: energy transducer TonB [Candidatus Acidiferrales bacterium]